MFRDSGLEVKQYRYYDKKNISLDLDGMIEDIKVKSFLLPCLRQSAPDGSIILLHACAHNPTGVDPTQNQWKIISEACKAKSHFIFFDLAYLSFASGDPDKDAWSLRYFVDQGHPIALAQSFAKNFGLYGERVGAFSLVCDSQEEMKRVESQLKILVRAMFSNPPIHGARIVAEILGDKGLTDLWRQEVKGMADRIISMSGISVDFLLTLGVQLRNHLEKDLGSSVIQFLRNQNTKV